MASRLTKLSRPLEACATALRMASRNPSAQRGVESHAVRRRLYCQFTLRVPVLRHLNRVRFHENELYLSGPARRSAAIVDSHHLVEAKPIDVIFSEEKFRVLNQEIAYAVEYGAKTSPPAQPWSVNRQASIVVAVGPAVEKVEALFVKTTTGMVVNKIEDDGDSI